MKIINGIKNAWNSLSELLFSEPPVQTSRTVQSNVSGEKLLTLEEGLAKAKAEMMNLSAPIPHSSPALSGLLEGGNLGRSTQGVQEVQEVPERNKSSSMHLKDQLFELYEERTNEVGSSRNQTEIDELEFQNNGHIVPFN